MNALYIRNGNRYTSAPPEAVLGRARDLLSEHFRSGEPVLENPLLIETFLTEKLATREYEVFALILLDHHRRLIEYVEIARGTHNFALVHPREVIKAALHHNAAGVVFVHNHPSGDARPSSADVETTLNLKRILALVDIEVIDHFLVGKNMTSFALSGLLR